MQDLKIKVSNGAESEEAQELFFKLGYMVVNNMDCEKGYIVASKDAESPINFDYWHNVKNIATLAELRDMVASQRSNDEPFLTPECTLRQQTIEATLAERGSRYGDFESVAGTTRALMRTLADADRFDELSAAQYEALHMICSKMARIVNGDPDYTDNWHDIAGYAKLVEDTI